MRCASGFIRRNFEGDQFGAEAAGAKGPVSDAGSHPYNAQHQRRTAEMDPDEAANQEPEGGRDQSCSDVRLVLSRQMMDEGRGIHAHEADKGAEIERLGADFIGASAQSCGKELKNAGSGKRKAPTATMLLRGMRRLGSMAPKNDLGSALPRPMPYSSRPAASCEPMPEPMLAMSSVKLMIWKSTTPPTCRETRAKADST